MASHLRETNRSPITLGEDIYEKYKTFINHGHRHPPVKEKESIQYLTGSPGCHLLSVNQESESEIGSNFVWI